MIQEQIKADFAYRQMVKRETEKALKKALEAFRKGEKSAEYLEGLAA